ncbi:MAG TPA: autotransporter assembly complex family protein [Thermoanaerobaculia bacterium]|jgi:translocation and assembly module TamA
MRKTAIPRRWLALGLLLGALPAPLHAARLKVEVDGVKRDLERNIRSALSLEKLDRDELTEERIRRLHADAPEEIEEALQPFGYYRPQVRSELRQEKDQWIARYEVDPGPPVKIASVDLQITGDGADDPRFREIAARFPVKQGAVLFHPDYEQGKQALVDLAAEEGYLDATFRANEVRVSMARYQADVVLHYDTGPRYRFGEVRFNQNVLDPDLLKGYVTFKPGEPLDVNKVLEMQNAISDSPYWSRVEVVTRQDQAKGLEVPIDVDLVPSKTMRFSGGVGYGTDSGPRVNGAWELRRLNRRGHRAEAEVRASQIEQNLRVSYFIPGPYPRTDVLSYNLGYDREDTDTSLSETGLIGAQLTQARGGWREAFSLTYQREDFEVGLDQGVSNLLVPGASWERVKADDRIFATKGYRLLGSFQGAEASLLSDSSFLQADVQGKVIRTLGERNRVIGRAEVGYTVTDEFRELPPRFRFFAGGDRSVRGFAYQALGEEDEAGNVIGGKALLVGSLEYELWFPEMWGQKLGAAVFYDAGNAFKAFGGALEQGAGVGLRWRSPIGPVRADFAWALSEEGRPFRFHLNIGPDL